MGLLGLVSIGIGSIIGAGIFSMMGVGISYTGRTVWLALLLSALLVFFQNFRGYVFSGVFVLDGGRYAQAALTTPPIIAGASAVQFLVQNLGNSVMSIAIVSYLSQISPTIGAYPKISALIIASIAFALTVKGTGFLAKIQTLLLVCMYAALALFAAYGIMNINPDAYAGEPALQGGLPGLRMATVLTSYACQGATNIIDVTKDAKNPKRNIPKALVLSTLICAGIYVVLGIAATYSMPYADIAGQSLGAIAQNFMPKNLYLFFVIGGAVLALSTTLLGTVAAMPWPIHSAAMDGWLPDVFRKKSKGGYPWVVMLAMYLIVVIPIIGGFSLSSIVSYILVPSGVMGLIINIINLNMPEKYPAAWAKRTIPVSTAGYKVIMIISCVLNVAVASVSLVSLTFTGLCLNLVMTACMFLWAYSRIKMGKVDLEARENNRIAIEKAILAEEGEKA